MIGQQVGQFRIRARLGQGGMGEVYLADDSLLRRKVALKFVTGDSDPEAGRRLQHEAYAVAALDHPFICKVYEAGEQDGRRCLAMEYVEGQTMKDRLTAGPLPPGDVARLAKEIAEALDFAHTRGIVHRDLKPANIMLAADGHVKVMDFGIAKRLAPEGGDWTTRSTAPASGELTGTLAYMSPEQVRGQPVDARSDIFAFGIVLYELLTGENPFRRHSAFETAEAIVRESPAPLEGRVKDVPPGLAALVARCLEKDRDRRYPAFREIGDDLTHRDSAAPTQPVGPRPRSRRTALGVVAAASAVVVLALAWWRPGWLPLSEPVLAFGERDWIIAADFENLTGDKVFDQSLNTALEVAIAQSKYVNVFPRHRLQASLQRMRKAPETPVDVALAGELAQREGLRAVLAPSIALVGDTYSLAARVIDPTTQTIVIRESVEAGRRDKVLEALNDLAARVRRRLGESIGQLSAQSTPLPLATTASVEALKLYADSFRMRDEQTGQELLRQAIALDPDFALAMASLGYRYYLQSNRESRTAGDELFTKAMALANRLTTRERLWISAAADDARGNREQAVAGYKTYLAQYPDDTRAWFRLGWTYMATLRRIEEAAEAFRRVTEVDPRDSGAWINLATCYKGLPGRLEDAVATYQKAFALSPDDLLGMYVNGEYGAALVRLGRMGEAREAFEKMIRAPEAVKQARGHRSVAYLEMHVGRYREAVAQLERAIQINEGSDFALSAFRDRLIRARVHLALGTRTAADRDLAAVNGWMAKLTLGPEWLSQVVGLRAALGQIGEAQRVLAILAKAVGNTLTDTTVSRNLDHDQGHLDLSRSAVELTLGRPEEAVRLVAAAGVRLGADGILAESARALHAAGRLDDAAEKYRRLIELAPFGYEQQQEVPAAHVALGAIHERQGRPADARALYEKLITQWKDGDADLLVLQQARARLASLKK